jgi:Flp pilus assembly protein TadB
MARRVEGVTAAAPLRLLSAQIEIARMPSWQTLLYRVLSSKPGRRGLYVPRKRTLVLASLFGMIVGIVTLRELFHLPDWLVITGSIALALVIPRLLGNFERRRQSELFIAGFPDAMDMLVRMLRAGIPVSGAIEIVGAESPDPVGRIFRGFADEMSSRRNSATSRSR